MNQKKVLFDYQRECVEAIIQGWREKEVPYAQMDTGSGKSLVCAELIKRSLKFNYRCLCLVPSQELVSQNYKEFVGYTDHKAGICSSKLGRFEIHEKVVFSTYTSFLNRRTKAGKFDVCIIDEHHLVSNDPDTSYRKIIRSLLRINPALRIAGVSATPCRLGSGMSHESCVKGQALFTKLVYKTDIAKLIESGRLSHVMSINSNTAVNLDGIKNKGHDYDQEEAGKRFEEILAPGVSETKRLFNEYNIQTALIFASNLTNAQMIVEEWGNDNECKIAHGDMDKRSRANIVNWLMHGINRRVIVNVGLFVTGFNFEALESVVLFIATKSLTKYKQAVGRCLRVHNDKDCSYVIDFGGNIDYHGPIDATLPPRSKKKRGDKPEKMCLECNETNLLSAKKCKKCEAEFISEGKEGNYRMRTKADILARQFETVEVLPIPYCYKCYSSKDSTPMIKMIFNDFEYGGLVHEHYLTFDHTGGAKARAEKFLLDLLINKGDYYELCSAGISVDNLLTLFENEELYKKYFRQFKSITLKKNEGSRYKELIRWGFV